MKTSKPYYSIPILGKDSMIQFMKMEATLILKTKIQVKSPIFEEEMSTEQEPS